MAIERISNLYHVPAVAKEQEQQKKQKKNERKKTRNEKRKDEKKTDREEKLISEYRADIFRMGKNFLLQAGGVRDENR